MSSNLGVFAATCDGCCPAPSLLWAGETISIRPVSVLSCAGVWEVAWSWSDAVGAETSSGVSGSGNRRGPTLSETHSESSTPRIIKSRAPEVLIMLAPIAIS